MAVVINKKVVPLVIPEMENKMIPPNGRPHILPDDIAKKYKHYLDIIPQYIIDENESLRKERDSLKKELKDKTETYEILLKKDKEEILSLRKPFIEHKEEIERQTKDKWIDTFRCNKNNVKFDFLYSFHFNDEHEREQAIQRLKYSIYSIKKQNVNICVCNTSMKCIYKEIKRFAKIKYIHRPIDIKVYCKPSTINYGVRMLVTTPYFFHSDIDLIYPPTFIQEMCNYVSFNKPSRIIFYNSNIGKELYTKSIKKYKEYFNINKDNSRTAFGIAPGNGLIHLESFKLIGGYDEKYIGYGIEDADFNLRIGFINDYKEIDNEKINTYHMYHSTYNIDDNYEKNKTRYENKKYDLEYKRSYKRNVDLIKVNDENWGFSF